MPACRQAGNAAYYDNIVGLWGVDGGVEMYDDIDTSIDISTPTEKNAH